MGMTTELLIPFAPTEVNRWSIARVVVASEAEQPLLARLAAFGPAHYPAGAGRAIVTLADQREGLLDLLEREGSVEVVAHEDYDASWRLPAEPVSLAGGLEVVAAAPAVSPGAKRIVLHPGLAFGDCRHPTTRLCVEAIAERARERPLRSLLDVGSGSGVLALAAYRLGASRVVATDIDPYARFVTEENARRNGVALEVTHPIPEGARFDVVVASVWASAFPSLAPSLERALAGDGVLVVSGFPATESASIAALFPDLRCTPAVMEGWGALVARRQNT
ncbi:MAG: 50S ribosomal protein L11 methyltransferase [Labilithrix sp.]|nr:50S ribosomal protein L11 methyltransferase [Labilithrix sp.]